MPANSLSNPLEAPEQYLRATYGGAFSGSFDTAFCYDRKTVGGNSVISRVSLGPDVVWARIIGTQGNPGAPVVWVPELQAYYIYDPDSGVYERVGIEAVKARYHACIEEVASAVSRVDQGLASRIAGFRRESLARSVAQSVSTQSILRGSRFEASTLLHVRNGVLDMSTLGRVDHSPDLPALVQVGTDWRPDAPEPVRFLEWIRGMLPSNEDVELFLQCLALAFIGNPTQTILVLIGHAGAGKSETMHLMELLLGENLVRELRLRQAGERFEAMFWRNARLLHVPELTTADLRANPQMLKKISGQDSLAFEAKGSSVPMQIRPKALVMAHANGDIRIPVDGDAGAWERRLVVLHVKAGAGARAPVSNFAETLFKQEGSGILRLLVERAHALLQRPALPITARHRAAAQATLGGTDPLLVFVERNLMAGRGSALTFDEVCAGARAYLLRHGHHVPPDLQLLAALRTLVPAVHGVRESRSIKGELQGWRRLAFATPGEGSTAA